MGTRIEINLAALLGNPNIKITLSCEEQDSGDEQEPWSDNIAEVTVIVGSSAITRTFDYHAGPDSKIRLSADFNFFRDPVRHTETMRMLYEASVPFRVLP